jgi:glycogen(starch) synthase
MRLALISFEFPPAVAIGGIGAYAWEAARMMAGSGWDVEVFAAGTAGAEPAEEFGVTVHRVVAADRAEFRAAIREPFAARHRARPFDVLESPEIGAEGWAVAERFPEIARVVKLHTPTYLVGKIGYEVPTFLQQARFFGGALRRGRLGWIKKPAYDRDSDLEYRFTRAADVVAAPSRAIRDRVGVDWSLASDSSLHFPYPYRPSAELLGLPVTTGVRSIGFLGRMEARKGVVELARAIPSILAASPELRFRFLGPSWPFGRRGMQTWISRHCRAHLANLVFVGAVGRDQLATELAACDVVVLPSRWENFPFACWESLAAGRAVIGSSAGGMADVIEDGISGLLIEPSSPEAISHAVLSLAREPGLGARLAYAGRQRVLDLLAPAAVLPAQVAAYIQAVEQSKTRRNMINRAKP